MLISPSDAEHFLRVYKAALTGVAELEPKDVKGFIAVRGALYQGKYKKSPPTDDEELIAALKTAVYDHFIMGRHLARSTEMVGPKEKVYWVKGITTELNKLAEKSKAKIKQRPRQAGGRNMPQPKEDKKREERITMEVVVDAYNEEERAMGWYYYLEDKLHFPFAAECTEVRSVSPLEMGDEVEVVAMAPERECEHEMCVEMRWQKRNLAVPLSQLRVTKGDGQTKEAVADWHYWVSQGYQF